MKNLNNKKTDKFIINILDNLNNMDDSKWENYTIPQAMPQNLFTKRHYTGFNVLSLAIDMMIKGYATPYYATFNSIREAGGKLKKGSKGSIITFYKISYRHKLTKKYLSDKKIKELSKEELKGNYDSFATVKYYHLFNADCIENIEELDVSMPILETEDQIFTEQKNCENFISDIVKYGELDLNLEQLSSTAYYSLTYDHIVIPKKAFFKSSGHYYSTIFHEMIHWTGNINRLNREMKGFNQDKAKYANEELIAELGAMLLTLQHGISSQLMNSIKYLKGWLKATKDFDQEYILSEAFKNSKEAKKYLENLKNTQALSA